MTKPIFFLTTLLLFSGFFRIFLQQEDNEHILFLNLKMINGHIHIEDFNVVQGKLKSPKIISYHKDNILVNVKNIANDMLYEAAISDPSDLKYEYENAEGSLETKQIVLDSVNFTVRIPYDPSIYEVEFYKIQEDNYQYDNIVTLNNRIGSVLINKKNDSYEK